MSRFCTASWKRLRCWIHSCCFCCRIFQDNVCKGINCFLSLLCMHNQNSVQTLMLRKRAKWNEFSSSDVSGGSGICERFRWAWTWFSGRSDVFAWIPQYEFSRTNFFHVHFTARFSIRLSAVKWVNFQWVWLLWFPLMTSVNALRQQDEWGNCSTL